jgi:FkbM family methyltransferase
LNTIKLPSGRRVSCIDKLTARYVYNEIFVDHVYTPAGIEIRQGDVIFDVGANTGMFTLFAAEQVPDATIHAFEPVPPIFAALQANIASLGPRVHAYNIGLGETTGNIDIHYYPRLCGDSTATPFDFDSKVARYVKTYDQSIAKDMPIARIVPRAWRDRVVRSSLKRLYTGPVITCPIRRLSDIIAEQHVTRIDLLKVDAENAERQVLAGITREDWDKIRQVSMEVHAHIKGGENLLAEMRDLLASKGFHVTDGAESRETIMGVFMLHGKK